MTHAPHNLVAAADPVPVGSATVADATAGAERYLVELAADGNDPREGPAVCRLRRWLKTARRSHGLTAVSVAPVPTEPTGHLAQTNHGNGWRPRGRSIRRATEWARTGGRP